MSRPQNQGAYGNSRVLYLLDNLATAISIAGNMAKPMILKAVPSVGSRCHTPFMALVILPLCSYGFQIIGYRAFAGIHCIQRYMSGGSLYNCFLAIVLF